VLRERFGVQRVVILGDFVRPEPLHFWSELTLVVSGLPSHSYDVYTTLRKLGSEPELELRRIEELSPRQAAALPDEGREL
jgi:predicted nucleotidyltransferase